MRVIQTPGRQLGRIQFTPDCAIFTALSREPVPAAQPTDTHLYAAALCIDLTSGEEVRRLPFPASNRVALAPRGSYLAFVPDWALSTERPPYWLLGLRTGNTIAGAEPLPAYPLDMTFVDQGTLAFAHRAMTRVDLAKDGGMGTRYHYPAEWFCVTAGGRFLVAGHNERRVRVCDRPRNNACEFDLVASSMVAAENGQFAAVRGTEIVLGRLDRRTVEATIRMDAEQCTAMAFSPDGQRLATTGTDGRVCFWDSATGELLDVFEWDVGSLYSLAFAPDGLTCAAGGDNGVAVLWDVDG